MLVWRVSLCGLEVVALCEFQCSRHNRSKGNVLCFCKSQQGYTLSGSRLTLEVWQVTKSLRNGRYKHFRHEKYMFGCMLASGWLLLYRDCALMDENISVMNKYSQPR